MSDISRVPGSERLGDLSTAELIREIAIDTRVLLEKEIQAGRLELKAEVAQAKNALAYGALVSGAALAATVGLTFMLAHLLLRYTRLTEWAAFGVVAALFIALGAIGAAAAKRQARATNLVPDRAVHDAHEDMKVLRESVAR